MFLKRLTLLLSISMANINAYSQNKERDSLHNPPISVETLFSNRGATFQMIIDKKFKSIPRLGFFSVTNFVGEWDNNHVEDHMTQASLTFEVVKGLNLSGGFHLTPVTGVRPSAGIIYTFANKEWLLVTNSRVDLSKDANVEGLVLIEYKPKINERISFYSRLQGLYAYNTSLEKHSRSYIMARAGISYKEFTFGVGTNIDYYGPIKHNENSVGGFLSFLLL